MVFVREQDEVELLLGDELGVAGEGIRADADDFDISFSSFFVSVAEPARFFRSARGVVFGIEKQDYCFPLKI